MDFSPFSDGCGVVVNNVQLADVNEDQLAEIKAAFIENGLLFFRDQNLSEQDHINFARSMGDIVVNKFFKPIDGFPEIAEVRKAETQKTNIGGAWHTDHSYDPEPAKGSILVARTLPETGGDTHYANLANAYDALSPDLKEQIKDLRVIHSNDHLYGENGLYRSTDIADQLGGMDQVGKAIHPVVIRHPESGRKILYVNPGHSIGIEGWDMPESFELFEKLYKHVEQPEFTCRFNWQPGSVALWDNRSTWHYAQNDYFGQARLMHRITLNGSSLQAAN